MRNSSDLSQYEEHKKMEINYYESLMQIIINSTYEEKSQFILLSCSLSQSLYDAEMD